MEDGVDALIDSAYYGRAATTAGHWDMLVVMVAGVEIGSSKLAQGSVGQHTLVDVERWHGRLPEIKVLSPPPIEQRD